MPWHGGPPVGLLLPETAPSLQLVASGSRRHEAFAFALLPAVRCLSLQQLDRGPSSGCRSGKDSVAGGSLLVVAAVYGSCMSCHCVQTCDVATSPLCPYRRHNRFRCHDHCSARAERQPSREALHELTPPSPPTPQPPKHGVAHVNAGSPRVVVRTDARLLGRCLTTAPVRLVNGRDLPAALPPNP